MVEVVLGMFGVSMAGLWATLWTVKTRVEAQTQALVASVGLLEDLNEVATSLASGPDGTAEMIETISNMHVPTGQDHMMSAAASLLQMWGMSKWGGGGSLGQLLGMPIGAEAPAAEPSYPPN